MAMQSIELRAQKREQLGTRASRRLRREGRLPAVVYGHQQEVLSVTLPLDDTLKHLQRGAHLFSLQMDGTTEQVLLKDVQYDHLGDEILHVDLFRVNLDEEITSEVSVHLVGEPKGIKAGGVLSLIRDSIEVICRVRDLPDEIEVNVSAMDLGDVLHIGEVPLPEGVRLADPEADFTVATVAAPKIQEEEEAAAEAPAEPEIIGQKKEDEEDAAAKE
jgi:large subunit ribosomal protein L25